MHEFVRNENKIVEWSSNNSKLIKQNLEFSAQAYQSIFNEWAGNFFLIQPLDIVVIIHIIFVSIIVLNVLILWNLKIY